MKRLICREQNHIKTHSKNFDGKLTLGAVAMDLLSKRLRISSVTTLSLRSKLGTNILLGWCSYGMTYVVYRRSHTVHTAVMLHHNNYI